MNLYPFQSLRQKPSCLSGVIISAFLLLSNSVAGLGGVAYSQVTPPITSSGLNTQISAPINLPAGNVQYDIIGGTRPDNGPNLFHSFGEFVVPTNNIANFLNETALPTSNILGRVTGGNVSSIFGTILTTGFENANLFLINPAGLLFGPNATVNVGGMVTFTSADYLKLADNARLNAIPNAAADTLLSASPVAAFGFLGTNPSAITVQGSQFTVTEGADISLVGGNITIQSGTLEDTTVQPARLSAPGGQINLASADSPGEVLASNFASSADMTLGSITLSEGSVLNVSANTAGSVRIRSGALVMDNATISAETVNADGVAVAVDIQVTADLSMSTNLNPAITARTSGSGNAGGVRIASANLTAISNAQDFTLALIDTHASGSGKAGNISITAGDLQATGPLLPFWFIDSGIQGPGNGGDVTINARNIVLHQTEISTGDSRARILPIEQDVTGSGGNINITADSLDMTLATIISDAFGGHGGDITLAVGDIQMKQASQVGVSGLKGSGAFMVNANRFVMDSGGLVEADTAFVPGKPVIITANILELKNGSAIRSHTVGNVDAGDIVVTASDHVTLSDGPFEGRPSGFYSSTVGFEGVELDELGGNAGSIRITTPRLEMSGGARIDTSTQTSGRGGDVTITAGSTSITGERTLSIPEDEFDIADSRSSGVFSRTVGIDFCSGPCGSGGQISITTSLLTLGNEAAIDTTSNSTGHGGGITINAGQSVQLGDGASISTSSTGPGDAGNILIDAGQQFEMRNSSVTTKSEQAGGGDIAINATEQIRLVDSEVNASAFLDGGNITIDPILMILQNSQILAQAVQGAGGNITITTPLFLADQSSFVSASSQFGLNGTVTIQSPTSNLSGSLGPLASKTNQAQSLLTQRCAALVNGQASSFVVAGREQLPSDPGSWLSGPIALAGIDVERFGEGTVAEGTSNLEPRTSNLLASDRVSLRRLTPTRFLMANFADSEATGCHS